MNRHRLFRDLMRDIQDEVLRTIPHVLEIFFYTLILFFVGECMAVSPTLQNFNTGAVSHHLEGRPDFKKYQSSNRIVENMFVTIQGPVQRRPGTRFIVQVAEATGTEIERPAIDPCSTGISTPQGLQNMNNDLTADYQLLNNIDMTGFDWTPVGEWLAPFATNSFTGTLDGRYYTISNLTLNDPVIAGEGYGMFGSIYDNNVEVTRVQNLILEDINYTLTGMPGVIGGLTGHCQFIGSNYEAISNVLVTGQITRDPETLFAGLYFTEVAGFIGDNESAGQTAEIARCGADVDLILVGTKVGTDYARSSCFVQAPGNSIYEDCYSQGRVYNILDESPVTHKIQDAGGFTGQASSTTTYTRCYSATDYDLLFGAKVGGFIRSGGSPVRWADNHWDKTLNPTLDDSGDGDVDNIEDNTTAEMYAEATFTNWDFTANTGVWQIDEGNDYPVHQWAVQASQLPRELSNDVIRLISFEISTDVSFIIEAGNQYFRFIKDGG